VKLNREKRNILFEQQVPNLTTHDGQDNDLHHWFGELGDDHCEECGPECDEFADT